MSNPHWTIEQLQRVAAAALRATVYTGPPSGRVRAVPDMRAIRYYTTLGIIDRPSSMEGRTAYYDRSHVQQIVAIKRLQSDGLSLAEIQQNLASATSASIARIAAIPASFWNDVDTVLATDRAANRPSDAGARKAEGATSSIAAKGSLDDDSVTSREDSVPFWAVSPEFDDDDDPSVDDPRVGALPAEIQHYVEIPIAAGMRLQIDMHSIDQHTIDAIDMRRIASAAAPLLQELARQGLINTDIAAKANSDSIRSSSSSNPSLEKP